MRSRILCAVLGLGLLVSQGSYARPGEECREALEGSQSSQWADSLPAAFRAKYQPAVTESSKKFWETVSSDWKQWIPPVFNSPKNREFFLRAKKNGAPQIAMLEKLGFTFTKDQIGIPELEEFLIRVNQVVRDLKIPESAKILPGFLLYKDGQVIALTYGEEIPVGAKYEGSIVNDRTWQTSYFQRVSPMSWANGQAYIKEMNESYSFGWHDVGQFLSLLIDPDLMMAVSEVADRMIQDPDRYFKKDGEHVNREFYERMVFVAEAAMVIKPNHRPELLRLLGLAADANPEQVELSQLRSQLEKLGDDALKTRVRELLSALPKMLWPVGGVAADLVTFELFGRKDVTVEGDKTSYYMIYQIESETVRIEKILDAWGSAPSEQKAQWLVEIAQFERFLLNLATMSPGDLMRACSQLEVPEGSPLWRILQDIPLKRMRPAPKQAQ